MSSTVEDVAMVTASAARMTWREKDGGGARH